MTTPDPVRDALAEALRAVPASSRYYDDDADAVIASPAWPTLVRAILASVAGNARLVRVAPELLDVWGSRTEYGERITVEWGEPDASGVYEPVFTAHDDPDFRQRILASELTTERLAAAIHEVFCHRNARMHSDPYHSAEAIRKELGL